MLSQDQVTHFQSEGYAVFADFLTQNELSELLAEIDRVGQGQTLASHDKTRMEYGAQPTVRRRLHTPHLRSLHPLPALSTLEPI